MKSRKFNLRAADHLATDHGKRHFNERHFAESAPRYDIATRGLSLCNDASWKKQLIAALPDLEEPVCVDVACGTGDVARLLANKYRKAKVLGTDLTSEMVGLARKRNPHPHLEFTVADMGRLPVADASVDILTGSYAIRNAANLDSALNEFHRVLKPGGTLALLDFGKPASATLQKLQYHVLRVWGGFWGWLLHGNPEVHGYISQSLRNFPDKTTLTGIFIRKGFHIIETREHFFGMTMHCILRKPDIASDRLREST